MKQGVIVSIQPKPKKGLVGQLALAANVRYEVSIQPKPKKGLVAFKCTKHFPKFKGFNPAEAEEGFSS